MGRAWGRACKQRACRCRHREPHMRTPQRTQLAASQSRPAATLARAPARPPDGDEVFEGLGHLEPLNAQVPAVQEVVDPLLAAAGVVVRLGLEGGGEQRKGELGLIKRRVSGAGCRGSSRSGSSQGATTATSRRPPPAPARCRGGGSAGPRRPCGCPACRPPQRWPWRCTQCASLRHRGGRQGGVCEEGGAWGKGEAGGDWLGGGTQQGAMCTSKGQGLRQRAQPHSPACRPGHAPPPPRPRRRRRACSAPLTRPAHAPGAVPERLSRLGRLPQRKVAGVPLLASRVCRLTCGKVWEGAGEVGQRQGSG